MLFPQVSLRFDEVCLKLSPGLFQIRLGSPGLAVFLELPRFCDKAIGDADDLPFRDWLVRCGCIVHTLIQPRAEALEGIFGIVSFPELLVVIGQVLG